MAGFVFFAILLSWLFTLSDWAGPWIGLGYLVLISYLALSWGLFGVFCRLILVRARPGLHWAAIPALWVVLEFARSLTRFGFTWGYLSDSLYARPELIQISGLTGAWGVSFLIVLCNYLFFQALRHRHLGPAGVGLGLAVLVFLLGSVSMKTPPDETRPKLEMALVHSHVSQRERSDPGQRDRLLELYTNIIEDSVKTPTDLIVLPETILPGFILRDAELFSRFKVLAQEKAAWILLGTIDYKPERPHGLYNTAALISPQGQLVSEYDKVQLVPFSTEYFPLIESLRNWGLLESLLEKVPLGSLTPGKGFRSLRSDRGVMATPICFESIFPAISRAFVLEGAQVILTLTNDGWFKDSLALPQHFAKGVLRAVETGRYFVQASNAGISGIISEKGLILETTDSKKETILQGRIVLHEGWTLYTRYGDWFVYLCFAFMGGALLSAAFSKHTLIRLRKTEFTLVSQGK
jgi:apolipoprotein N-acyltransferase